MDVRVDDDYIDHGHMGPESGVAVAQPIAERIMVMLKGRLGKSHEQDNRSITSSGER
jgi:hypothetical protein